MSVSIGADPEVFIRDTRTGGVVPVCGLLGGTKDEPVPLPKLGKGYAVQEDNVMAEFNIPPCNNTHAFVDAIGRGLGAVRDLVRTSSEHLDLDFASSRMFNHDMLRSRQARQFGCSADFDAYVEGSPFDAVRPADLERTEGAWRFAGGHVHLGYTTPEPVPEYVVAQLCDVFLGLPSVALDQQGRRRGLYGQAGRYRPTDYGLEYRVLSNFWIFDEGLRMNVANRAFELCVALTNSIDKLREIYVEIPWADVQSAINNEDAELAADLLAYCVNDLQLQEAA